MTDAFRSRVKSVRVSEDEEEIIAHYAEQCGMSISEYMRVAAMQKIRLAQGADDRPRDNEIPALLVYQDELRQASKSLREYTFKFNMLAKQIARMSKAKCNSDEIEAALEKHFENMRETISFFSNLADVIEELTIFMSTQKQHAWLVACKQTDASVLDQNGD